MATVAGWLAVLATCTALAQVPAAPPTRVRQAEIHRCPAHPDILATWPARCPRCQTQLEAAPSAPMVAGVTPISIGPGIDMDARRRNEEEKAREAQRKEQLEEQTRQNAQLWGWHPNYGYVPPGNYPYTYSPPGSAYPYPYNYYDGLPPEYTNPYGQYYYNPHTGQFYYRPYYYNPKTGQYEYINPAQAPPNRENGARRERQEQRR